MAHRSFTIRELTQFLEKMYREKFYGKITFSYENGQVVFMKREETLKPLDEKK